jgi:hypothetical protein
MNGAVTVVGVRAEHGSSTLGIGTPAPGLSRRSETDIASWRQMADEIETDGAARGRLESDQSVFVLVSTSRRPQPDDGAPRSTRSRILRDRSR